MTDSARDVAQRRLKKVARMLDEAEGIEMDLEEERQARALAGLDPQAWTVLGDLRWPGRPFPNIDFVAVGPCGVFVVDTVTRPGVVKLRNDRLRIDDRPQDGLVLATTTAAQTVAEWLPVEYRSQVHPVLCLRRAQRLGGTSRGALICSTENLATTLTARQSWLEPQHVDFVTSLIRTRLTSSTTSEEPVVLPRPRRPATLPRQRKPPLPGATAGAKPLPPLAGPAAERRPRESRERVHLFWLVLAISVVMVLLVLGLEAADALVS